MKSLSQKVCPKCHKGTGSAKKYHDEHKPNNYRGSVKPFKCIDCGKECIGQRCRHCHSLYIHKCRR